MPARPFHRPAHRCKVGFFETRGEHAKTEHDACTRFTNGSVPHKASKVKRNFWTSPARQSPTPTRLLYTVSTPGAHIGWHAFLGHCCVFSDNRKDPQPNKVQECTTLCVGSVSSVPPHFELARSHAYAHMVGLLCTCASGRHLDAQTCATKSDPTSHALPIFNKRHNGIPAPRCLARRLGNVRPGSVSLAPYAALLSSWPSSELVPANTSARNCDGA